MPESGIKALSLDTEVPRGRARVMTRAVAVTRAVTRVMIGPRVTRRATAGTGVMTRAVTRRRYS